MRQAAAPEDIPASHGLLHRGESLGGTAVDDAAAALARAGTDVDQPVRVPHHVHRMLHDEQAVASALEPVEDAEQRADVLRMKPCGRFIEHVDHTEQFGGQLGREPQSL